MKDIDRANILDGLVIEIVFGKVEKSGVEKPSFRGGDIIISPPVLIGLIQSEGKLLDHLLYKLYVNGFSFVDQNLYDK